MVKLERLVIWIGGQIRKVGYIDRWSKKKGWFYGQVVKLERLVKLMWSN